MTIAGSIGILAVIALILIIGIPLGDYLYYLFRGEPSRMDKVFHPLEKWLFRAVGADPSVKMDWKAYLRALIMVNFAMMIFAYLVFRLQGVLPLNPAHIKGMPWDLAFNTAASFITNTNWQNYAGEQSMSYLGQMLGITYLQFTSAAHRHVAIVHGIDGSRGEGSRDGSKYTRHSGTKALFFSFRIGAMNTKHMLKNGIAPCLIRIDDKGTDDENRCQEDVQHHCLLAVLDKTPKRPNEGCRDNSHRQHLEYVGNGTWIFKRMGRVGIIITATVGS